MKQIVYKYPLKFGIDGLCHIDMPIGAQILSVHEQNDEPTMWAKVDPNAVLEGRHFFIAGTGQPLPTETYKLVFIETIFDDPFVWHIFEALKPE